MKWPIKTEPKLGDYREVEKFAWLPTRCVTPDTLSCEVPQKWLHYRVWLEHYVAFEEYKTMAVYHGKFASPEDMWVTISNNVILKDKK